MGYGTRLIEPLNLARQSQKRIYTRNYLECCKTTGNMDVKPCFKTHLRFINDNNLIGLGIFYTGSVSVGIR